MTVTQTIHKSFEQELEEIVIKELMDKIKYKIMIMSNKGGVGKSTVSANLANELANQGNKVGLLDIDIHGPSQAKIFGIHSKFKINSDGKIIPFQPKENLQLISIAGILDYEDQPIIWRGPMKYGAIRDFLKEVTWGELDYLIIDAPPGTGDEPLAIGQLLQSLNGIIIVTTPQDLAVLDAKKAIKFAEKINANIIGFIENMSIIQCPHCGQSFKLFKSNKEKQIQTHYHIDLLGELPFEPTLMQSMDCGILHMNHNQQHSVTHLFQAIIEKVKEKLTSSQ